MAVRAGHPARPARTNAAAGRWAGLPPRGTDRPTHPRSPAPHRFPRPHPPRGSGSSPGPEPPRPSRRTPRIRPIPTGHFPVPPQAPVRTPPPPEAHPATAAAGYAEFGATTWIRQPVACRSAPISPGSVPPARPIAGPSAPNRPARAAQTVAVRYRIRPPRPRRPRAAARSSNRPAPTTSSPLWPGRPERCPAHFRSPRRARQPVPPRRWHRPERAWRSAC